jgi:hypothetical protein
MKKFEQGIAGDIGFEGPVLRDSAPAHIAMWPPGKLVFDAHRHPFDPAALKVT